MSQDRKKTPKRARVSIRRDPISARDYLRYKTPFACEDCTHFKHSDASCTLGYGTAWHRKAFQTEEYFRTGKMALCRFLEID